MCKTFAARLGVILLSIGKTVKEAADMSGIQYSTIRSWLYKKQVPTMTCFIDFVDGLELPDDKVLYLLGRCDNFV